MDYKIFDTLLEPVFVIDQDKKILYCNEAAALIADSSVRKLCRGQIFDQCFSFKENLSYLSQIDTVTDASPYIETPFEATSGKQGRAQITTQPIDHVEAGKKAWIIYFRDVTLEETLQKKFRAELDKVEFYTKNLERLVEERTTEIKKLNQMMTALLDSLHQGFFLFDQSGKCLEVYSKACETVIENKPAGKQIWDVLRLNEKEIPGFQKWMTTLFAEMLPFEDLSPLGPQKFNHSQGKHIQLEYFPLKSSEGNTTGVVVVASDITNLIEAQREAEHEKAYAKMILKLIQNRRQVASFLTEAKDLLAKLHTEIKKGTNLDQENTFRILHTIKGGSASFSIKAIADECHEAENILSSFKWDGLTESGLLRLHEKSAAVEEKFNAFLQESKPIIGDIDNIRSRKKEIDIIELYRFRGLLHFKPELSKDFTEKFIMEPAIQFFSHYNEVVKNVAELVGKQMKPIQFVNAQVPVLPEAYENLFSTLIHAFRNAVDHGIEAPSVRQENGKDPDGQIIVKLQKTAGELLIQIEDDGGGVDPKKIRSKLLEKGIYTEKESDFDVIQHIFDSQFSTKEEVSETSGRGVGMDAIAFAAKKLGGKAWVESTVGVGTKLFVKVPYLLDCRREGREDRKKVA